VQPVKRLSQAVRSWRDGGPFDPGPLDGAPSEIVELARTFGQASTALRGREAELRQAAVRQDLLMQEIHHRVKNNLQIIASLLNLQASRIRLPEARAEFQAARDRIRALATLHRHLYAHDDLHSINMRSFLGELCGQLLATIGETPAGGRIRLDIEAPELQISSDQAVPMALIVTEVVSNAAKYAFPGGRSGHIRVRLDVDAVADQAQRARLMIEDDGVGIPAGRAETETGVRDGIGIQLIRGFARQLGATLTVTQDEGTRYVIDIPLHRARDTGDDADPFVA
jgi:two-component sensor histidine kinase